MRFFIDHEPIAQPRQRHRIVKNGSKSFVQSYCPQDHPVQAFKRAVQQAFRLSHPRFVPITGPITIEVEFLLPRPQYMFWKKREMPRVRHATKPDSDNLEKSLRDALTGVAWVDDCQVCEWSGSKWYCAGHERPGVEIWIGEIVETVKHTSLFESELT